MLSDGTREVDIPSFDPTLLAPAQIEIDAEQTSRGLRNTASLIISVGPRRLADRRGREHALLDPNHGGHPNEAVGRLIMQYVWFAVGRRLAALKDHWFHPRRMSRVGPANKPPTLRESRDDDGAIATSRRTPMADNEDAADGLITIKAFTARYGIGRSRIYELISAGALTALKDGARTLITLESAKTWREALPRMRSVGVRYRGP